MISYKDRMFPDRHVYEGECIHAEFHFAPGQGL